MKFLFFLSLSFLLNNQLWSQAYPVMNKDSIKHIELDEVKVYGSKKAIRSNIFLTKNNFVKTHIVLFCEENIAVKVSIDIKEFILIKSVEIPFRRKGINKIKQPEFYVCFGNSPSDSLVPIVPKEFKISQSKLIVIFDQAIKVEKNISEFFFLMQPNCPEFYFATGYFLRFSEDNQLKNTYEYTQEGGFKLKNFRKGFVPKQYRPTKIQNIFIRFIIN